MSKINDNKEESVVVNNPNLDIAEMVQLLRGGAKLDLSNNNGAKIAIKLCQKGMDTRNTEIMNLLIKNGFDINSESGTAVFKRNMSNKNLDFMIEHGFNNFTPVIDLWAERIFTKDVSTSAIESLELVLANASQIKVPKISEIKDASIKKNTLGRSVLFTAAQNDKPLSVKFLIESGFDVNEQDKLGQTPLFAATEGKANGSIKALLDSGANPSILDKDGRSAIDYNEEKDATKLFQAAIDTRDKEAMSLLIKNGFSNFTPVVHHLVEKIFTQGSLDRSKHIESLELVLANASQIKVLQISQIKDASIKKDSLGGSVLFTAAQNDKPLSVKFLIESGFDVNEQDQLGQTPLFAAIEGKANGSIKALLDNGADPSIVDVNGKSAIDYAKEKGLDTSIIELMRRKGNVLTAAQNGDLHLVQELLDNGADIRAVNTQGQSLLDLLLINSDKKFNNNKDLYKKLISRCANTEGMTTNISSIPDYHMVFLQMPKEIKIELMSATSPIAHNYKLINDSITDNVEKILDLAHSEGKKNLVLRLLIPHITDPTIGAFTTKTDSNLGARQAPLEICIKKLATVQDEKVLKDIFSQNKEMLTRPEKIDIVVDNIITGKQQNSTGSNISNQSRLETFITTSGLDIINTNTITPSGVSVPIFYTMISKAEKCDDRNAAMFAFSCAQKKYEGNILDLKMANNQPLFQYALDNDPGVFRTLIQKGDVRAADLLSIAGKIDPDNLFDCLKKHPDYINQKDSNGRELLLLACCNPNMSKYDIKTLVHWGAKFDYPNMDSGLKNLSFENVCEIASKYPEPKLISKILGMHPEYLAKRDKEDNSLLYYLLQGNASQELLSTVINKNPGILNNAGESPLLVQALKISDPMTVRFLIEQGADIKSLRKLTTLEPQQHSSLISKFKDDPDMCRAIIEHIPPKNIKSILATNVSPNFNELKTIEETLKENTKYKDILDLFEQKQKMPKPFVTTKFTEPEFLQTLEKVQTTFVANRAGRKLGAIVNVAQQAKENVSNLSSSNKNDLSDLKNEFLREASVMPYYMRHGVSQDESFPLILKSGHLLSETKLIALNNNNKETAPEKLAVVALNTEFDRLHKSHYFAFFGLGSDKDNLPAPSSLRDEKGVGYFILNNDEFFRTNPNQAKHLVVKGEDWGAMHDDIIKINGIEINVYYRNDSQVVSDYVTDHSIKYSYTDENNKVHEYSLKVTDEIAHGTSYKKGLAGFVLKHLEHLPEEAQKKILAPIAQAKSPEEKQKAVSDIVKAFYYPEASIGGSMPLKLEYVDVVSYPASTKLGKLDLKKFREDIQAGNISAVKDFMEKHPHAQEVPFIVEGALRIAKQGKNQEIIDYIDKIYQAKVVPIKFNDIIKVSDEFEQIGQLQGLILENGSTNTNLKPEQGGLRFSTVTQRNADDHTTTYNTSLAQLHTALGNPNYLNKPADKFFADDGRKEFVLPIKGPEDEIAARNNLLTFELTTLLTSAQNHDYFMAHGKPHPKTGKGAIDPSIANMSNRLDGYNIKASVNTFGHPVIEVDNPGKILMVKEQLSNTLAISPDSMVVKGNQIELNMSTSSLIGKMVEKKTKHSLVIPTTVDGNIMLQQSGDTLNVPVTHCLDPYHPEVTAAKQLQEVFGLEIKDPKNLAKSFTVTPTANLSQNHSKVFSIDANHFQKPLGRQKVNSSNKTGILYQDMRGKRMKCPEGVINTLLTKDEEMLKQALPKGIEGVLDKSFTKANECIIPSNTFGRVTFTSESPVNLKILALALKGTNATTQLMSDNTLVVEGIAPKKLSELVSSMKQRYTPQLTKVKPTKLRNL